MGIRSIFIHVFATDWLWSLDPCHDEDTDFTRICVVYGFLKRFQCEDTQSLFCLSSIQNKEFCCENISIVK